MDNPIPKNADPAIYVIAAHPNWRDSRVNRLLLQTAQDAATTTPRVAACDLYTLYPDYCIDAAAEQARVAAAQLIVLVHPIQWYSMPALQKLWLDDVLTYGWAYGGDSGTKAATKPGTNAGTALSGKDLWLVATTGGPETSYHPQSYNRYFFDSFLPPYEQTAALCGMRFLPPLILHGAHSASNAEVQQHVATFGERLQSYPNWPELDDLESCPLCEVPAADRPEETPVGAR